MTERIQKYQINISDSSTQIELHQGYELLSAHPQFNKISIWCKLDIDKPIVKKTFVCFGTGQEIPTGWEYTFIDTVFDNNYVWHIFERETGEEETNTEETNPTISYEDFYHENRISLLQYDNLREHFQVMVNKVLGPDYYNMCMDVYESDRQVCEDITARANETLSKKLIRKCI